MEKLIDEILDIFIENVSCHHSPDSDGSGQVFDHVEYDIDEAQVKEKIKELIKKPEDGKELLGQLGTMYSYARAHMEEMGVSKERREKFTQDHRKIRQLMESTYGL